VLNKQNNYMAQKNEQSGPDGPKHSNAVNSKVSHAHGTIINLTGPKDVKSLGFK